MNLAGLPVHPLEAGMFGIKILDFSDPVMRAKIHETQPWLELPYDEMYISYSHNAIVVGCLQHFLWRQLMISMNNETCVAARENIRAAAKRVLGEDDWKLSDEL